MKINKIKINSYGKVRDKEIDLKNGINIIYGKNEAGKSTILRFIVNSFYGISKNKKGKEYSDFERYTPWSSDEFSGKIEYELNNNNKYEVFREFKKKNPKIFNENKEDISKEFNIDKTKGNEFFYEQTKVDEELFLSTVVVGQQEVKLGNQEQNMLVQKIANLVGTGDDNVSYKRAIDRINRRQLDEVGTERSREKPINIVDKNIQELEREKQELEKYEILKYEMEENKNKLQKEMIYLENKNNLLKENKLLKEKENIENEKIKIKENIRDENNKKINLINNKIKEIKNNNKKILELNYELIKNNKKTMSNKNRLNKKIVFIFFLLIILNILQFIFIKNYILKYIFILTIPIFLIYYFIYKNKIIKTQKNIDKNNLEKLEKIKLEINNLNNEINLIEKNNINLEEEIINLKNNLNLKTNLEKEKIKNKYLNKLEKSEVNNLIYLENISYEIENIQDKINDKKIGIHTLEIEQKNIKTKLENLSKIEERLGNDKEKMLTLKNLNLSFNLAKEVLLQSYEKMKNTVTPKFTQELSKNISEITNEKYTNVMFNDELGLIVELDDGNYVPASKLSVGTIEQLYLSLRLSMIEELSEETMPIILDEAFAYYDTERLEYVLRYIKEKFSNHQIIIFTCTNREEKILDSINVSFNLINL